VAGQQYQENKKIWPKFPQLWTSQQFMTTRQTANETGIPYSWVHKGILKHFPMHCEGERERVSECCGCTQNLCCFEGGSDGDEQGGYCWTLKNQCKQQTVHLKLSLGVNWVLAYDLEMKHRSSNGMPICHQERKSCRSQNLSRKSCWSLLRGVCKIAKSDY
jgi:hypothetical protein